MITRNFIVMLFSGWIVNPLGIGLAHLYGVDNLPIVIMVLLGVSIGAPFQLFLNECVAPRVQCSRDVARRSTIAFVLLIQLCSYMFFMCKTSNLEYQIGPIVFLGVLLLFSNYLSYVLSIKYYEMVVEGNIRVRQSILVGALPGVVSFLVYCAYSISVSKFGIEFSPILLLTTILPAIIQYKYVKYLTGLNQVNAFDVDELIAPASDWFFVLTVGPLCALTIVSSSLRESVAVMNSNYVAIILVVLNSTVSLAITLSRALFLRKNSIKYQNVIMYSAIIIVVLLSIALFARHTEKLLIFLLATQFSIAVTVDMGRRFSVLQKK